jgi:hypothetical protein
MCFNLYQAVFLAKSPIHIGEKRLGFIQRTRYYIPGKSLWGAVTEDITRALFSRPQYADYIAIGEIVKEALIFSYFFITLDKNNFSKAFIPFLKEKPPKYGFEGSQISQMEFEEIFLSSYASTAITPKSNTALEASLHGIEYLNQVVRYKNKLCRVFFGGYLWAKEDEYPLDANQKLTIQCITDNIIFSLAGGKTKTLKDILNSFQIGGEKNYGRGTLSLLPLTLIPSDTKLWRKYQAGTDEDSPFLQIDNGDAIPAHLSLETSPVPDASDCSISGDLEPLTGREYDEKRGVGYKLGCEGVYYVPGSIVLNGSLSAFVGKYGTLQYSGKNCRRN